MHIYIRYSEESKAYKLYNPITKRVIIKRNVSLEKTMSAMEIFTQEDRE